MRKFTKYPSTYIQSSTVESSAAANVLKKFVGKDYLVAMQSTTGDLYGLDWSMDEMLAGKNAEGSEGFCCWNRPFYAHILELDSDKVVFTYIDYGDVKYTRYSEEMIDSLFTDDFDAMWTFQLPLIYVKVDTPPDVISKEEIIEIFKDRIGYNEG